MPEQKRKSFKPVKHYEVSSFKVKGVNGFIFFQKFFTKATSPSLECWITLKALIFLLWKRKCCCHFSLFEGMGFFWCCEHSAGSFYPRKKLFFLTPEAVGDRHVHKRISKIREAGCECHCTLLRVCQGWAGIK